MIVDIPNHLQNNSEKHNFLLEMGIDIDELHSKLEKGIVKKKDDDMSISKHIPMNGHTEKIMKGSENECDKLKESYLDTPHILLSTLKEKNNVTKILNSMGVNYKNYKNTIKKSLIDNHMDSAFESAYKSSKRGFGGVRMEYDSVLFKFEHTSSKL